MTRPVVVDTSSTYFSYNAQTDPLPLVASPATTPPDPPVENNGALQIVITVPSGDSYAVKSIAFIVDVGTTNALMQNTDDLQLTPPDPTWSFDPVPLSPSQVQFTLMPKNGTRVLTGTSLFIEIANFLTVQQACSTTVQINESITSPKPINPPPNGQGSLTITTFPDGFFFNSLGAFTLDGSAPVAEVANNTQVQLQWNSSAVGTTIWIYSSGNDPVEVPDIGSWTSDALTEDTVFTVSATQDGVVLTQSVAVTVASPEIIASSVTVNGPLTLVGGMKPGGSITPPDNWQQLTNSCSATASYMPSVDGFLTIANKGWQSGRTNGTVIVALLSGGIGYENTGGPFLVPFFAGQPIIIELTVNQSPLPSPFMLGVQMNCVLFGNGTVSPMSGGGQLQETGVDREVTSASPGR